MTLNGLSETMLFSQLIEEAGLDSAIVNGQAEVDGVVFDSRQAGPGKCFVAVKGWKQDGHDYISSAVTQGCAAVVCQDASRVPSGVVHAVAGDTRVALGRLAQAFHGWPARKLQTIGVTGTNGKSTVTYLVREILARTGREAALLGTISYQTGTRNRVASTTTPEPLLLAEMTSEMVSAGCSHLVMEVSSHALDQDRIAGLEFSVGAFTNLTGDHLDYHGTMADYLAAKRRLFQMLSEKAFAVINCDDPHGRDVARETAASVIWYGFSQESDLRGEILSMTDREMMLRLVHGGQSVEVTSQLIGKHNAMNCLTAAGIGLAAGVGLAEIGEALETVSRIPGRLERVNEDAPYSVFVDYAHTDDALANVLTALRPVTQGRLIVVFGCGGDRDRTKRPRMGKVAAELADCLIVTSDNPRSEDPQAIIDEILTGIDNGDRGRCDVQPDRRQAISMAVSMAQRGDVILLAGKGHETYQEINGQRTDFDDVIEARQAIRIARQEERRQI